MKLIKDKLLLFFVSLSLIINTPTTTLAAVAPVDSAAPEQASQSAEVTDENFLENNEAPPAIGGSDLATSLDASETPLSPVSSEEETDTQAEEPLVESTDEEESTDLSQQVENDNSETVSQNDNETDSQEAVDNEEESTDLSQQIENDNSETVSQNDNETDSKEVSEDIETALFDTNAEREYMEAWNTFTNTLWALPVGETFTVQTNIVGFGPVTGNYRAEYPGGLFGSPSHLEITAFRYTALPSAPDVRSIQVHALHQLPDGTEYSFFLGPVTFSFNPDGGSPMLRIVTTLPALPTLPGGVRIVGPLQLGEAEGTPGEPYCRIRNGSWTWQQVAGGGRVITPTLQGGIC